jgi:hypothetical protein
LTSTVASRWVRLLLSSRLGPDASKLQVVVDETCALGRQRIMSAVPPKADIDRACRDVRFVPKADRMSALGQKQTWGPLRLMSALPNSGHWNSVVECPLCANTGHMQCSKNRGYSITSSAATSKMVAADQVIEKAVNCCDAVCRLSALSRQAAVLVAIGVTSGALMIALPARHRRQ